MYKTVCGVQDGVLCTRRCVVYKTVCGVQDGVWCTRRCIVYKTVCGVQDGVWCTRRCVVYKTVCGVQDGVLCTRRCVVYKTVCGVQDGVWCTRRRGQRTPIMSTVTPSIIGIVMLCSLVVTSLLLSPVMTVAEYTGHLLTWPRLTYIYNLSQTTLQRYPPRQLFSFALFSLLSAVTLRFHPSSVVTFVSCRVSFCQCRRFCESCRCCN